MPRTRSAAALTAGTSLAALLAVGGPASAKCAPAPIDDVLEDGHTIAVVTRTDPGGTPATLRVEAAAGPKPPSTVTAPVDGPHQECRSYVEPGTVAAVSLHREEGRWVLGSTHFDLGQAFARALGKPAAVTGGPVVAYAAGNFGGARVVGLDREGRTVAWGGGYGYGDRVATCPGGSTVVVLGRPPGEPYGKRAAQVTVHDAATLRVQRNVRVPLGAYGRGVALRCGDDAGRRVDVLAEVSGRLEDRGRIVTVDGTRVTHRDVGPLEAGAAVPDGFVAVLRAVRADDTTLVRIGPRNTRTIARLADPAFSITGQDDALAVSPDGRTVALNVHRRSPAQNGVVTVDLSTGKILGSSPARNRYVTGLAWLGPKRLLVRDGGDRARLPLRLVDRRARPSGSWATVPSDLHSRIAAVGGDAIVYGAGSRLTAIPRSGAPFVADSLRLAAAVHIVGVPGGRFDAGRDD